MNHKSFKELEMQRNQYGKETDMCGMQMIQEPITGRKNHFSFLIMRKISNSLA